MWWAGDPNLREALLWGWEVEYWGRLGKFAVYLAGLTVVLDIIGPRRIRNWSTLIAGKFGNKQILVVILVGAVAAFIMLQPRGSISLLCSLIILAGLCIAMVLVQFVVAPSVAWILEHNKVKKVATVISAALFIAGFPLDILAS